MSFSKTDYSPEIIISVTHPWYPSETFLFFFPKRLSQAAIDADAAVFSLRDNERPAAARLAVINVVAEMCVREPEGFADFPTDAIMPEKLIARGLPQRVREYFDDPSKPELEAIILGAWRAYRASALPSAYLKSLQNNGARGGRVSEPTPGGAPTV